MQLMPFTALDLKTNIRQSELTDPEQNVSLGTDYLARVLKKFDGIIVLALAGYNAGPTRSARWKKNAKSSWDMTEFIEAIPYLETRTYVTSIIRNYYWYHYRVNGVRMTSLDYFWK